MKVKGFTLIELLVVVAIIGILATVVLASLGSARSKARDAKRQADIKTIQNQLELYYLDNGSYPISYGWYSSHNETSWNAFSTILGVSLPKDPINTSVNPGVMTHPSSLTSEDYMYSYFSGYNTQACDGEWYMIVYRVESTNPTSYGFKGCNGNTVNYVGLQRITVGVNNT